MTVSRVERELSILRTIADGDGQRVRLRGLDERDRTIVNELIEGQMITGTTMINDGGQYAITGKGEDHLERLEQRLAQQELAACASGGLQHHVRQIWNYAKKTWVILSVVALALWFLYSEVLSAQWICPKLSETVANALSKCE